MNALLKNERTFAYSGKHFVGWVEQSDTHAVTRASGSMGIGLTASTHPTHPADHCEAH